MKKAITIMIAAAVLAGCAASFASKYGTQVHVDKFEGNTTTVTMTGGVIDADYLGIVSSPAEFNPSIVKSKNGELILSVLRFSLERNTTLSRDSWLNITKGSTATFLLDGGEEKIVLEAHAGNIDYSVDAPQNQVFTTLFDKGAFIISPEQLKAIAYAKSIEVKVAGTSSSIVFPRQPNNHLIENFLPNLRKFYETEVVPTLN